jgi:hypothetical protein
MARFCQLQWSGALLADPGWVNRLRTGTLDGFNGYDAASALARLA